MEKTVTGIDLDEIRKAREEMMADMGMAPPPQPSTDYSKKAEEYDKENNESMSYEELSSELSTDEISGAKENDDSEEMSDEDLLALLEEFIAEDEKKENESADNLNESTEVENSEADELSTDDESNIENQVEEEFKDEKITDVVPDISELAEKNTSNTSNNDVNLSHYDAFAQFEINSGTQTSQNLTSHEQTVANQSNDSNLFSDQNSDDASIFDELDDEEDNIEDDLQENEEEVEIENSSNDESTENNDEDQAEIDFDVDEFVNNILDEAEGFEAEDVEKEDEDFGYDGEDEEIEENNVEVNENNQDQEDEIIKQQDIEEENLEEKPQEDNSKEIFKEFVERKKTELENQQPQEELKIEIKKDFLPTIDGVNFVNVLSMLDFKSSDSFTFALGKNEMGDVIYENLKQCYNIAFFANKNSYELLNSILLSLMLKNSANELKLALCDGINGNTFNYYSNTQYLYNGTIAKNDDEVCDMLTSIATELEERYHTLARFNVKSIDEYNILAKNTQTPKLSQILIVVDGYYDLMHSSNFEKIKSTLYQILRLGRIAGVYAIIVTDRKIEEDIINFNLPSRIGFKCSENDDSISMIGELGIDQLANNHEFLYSSINYDKAKHLRQPIISDAIIKILIDNIEK